MLEGRAVVWVGMNTCRKLWALRALGGFSTGLSVFLGGLFFKDICEIGDLHFFAQECWASGLLLGCEFSFYLSIFIFFLVQEIRIYNKKYIYRKEICLINRQYRESVL